MGGDGGGEVVGGAGFKGGAGAAFVPRGGKHQHRKAGKTFVSAQAFKDGEPVHDRHVEVEHDHVRPCAFDHAQRFPSVFRGQHGIVASQGGLGEHLDVPVIIDDQDRETSAGSGRGVILGGKRARAGAPVRVDAKL